MPIEIGIWKLGHKPQRVTFEALAAESQLEDTLVQDISILSADLMLVGRQVQTGFGKYIDILAMDREGNLAVVELKRDKTPREAVAQLLDYGSWVCNLTYDEVAEIYAGNHPDKSLEEGFVEAFGSDGSPEEVNQSHQLILVAAELDHSTERIINYLSGSFGLPVNAVFFRYFRDGDNDYLTRSWLIDPNETEAKITKKGKEAWDGNSFYVNVGEGLHRTWEDCRKYGFVSAGGSAWYSQTLNQLFPGAQIYVMIPKTGYVGVGVVKATAVSVKEFTVMVDGKETPILEAPLKASHLSEHAQDPEKYEHFVRVEWLKTHPIAEAYWEKGLFANQNTVCRLRNRFTLDRLQRHFGLEQ